MSVEIEPEKAQEPAGSGPAGPRLARPWWRRPAIHTGILGAIIGYFIGHWLGTGLADLAAILDPGCFVIGGGVSEAGDLLIGPARAAFRAGLTGGSYRPLAELRTALLGADAGLIGAADLARNA